jgi:enoyl-CoA hydratase
VVVTGMGQAFSAGLDLKVVPTYGPEEQRAMITAANRFLTRLYSLPRPTIAAVNGHAIAGGFVVVIACDYRIGTARPCKIGLTEARAGIPFPAAAMAILRAELSPPVARVLTLVARNVGPDAARAQGVLDELEPPDRVLSRAMEVARDMARIPAEAYVRIKEQLRGEVTARLQDLIARGGDPMFASWIGSDAPAAAAAVLRKESGA